MAEKSVKRDEYLIHPMFSIPDGTDEFVYEDRDYFSEEEEIEVAIIFDDSYLTEDGDVDPALDRPDTPDILGIISQTIRTADNGGQVVDVVIDVEDIPGITNYEVRVTKV